MFRECIHRVCEASGLRTASDKKRRKVADKKVIRMLGPSPPSMEKAGSNVQLTITSLWLKLSDLDSGEVICFDIYSNLYSKTHLWKLSMNSWDPLTYIYPFEAYSCPRDAKHQLCLGRRYRYSWLCGLCCQRSSRSPILFRVRMWWRNSPRRYHNSWPGIWIKVWYFLTLVCIPSFEFHWCMLCNLWNHFFN